MGFSFTYALDSARAVGNSDGLVGAGGSVAHGADVEGSGLSADSHELADNGGDGRVWALGARGPLGSPGRARGRRGGPGQEGRRNGGDRCGRWRRRRQHRRRGWRRHLRGSEANEAKDSENRGKPHFQCLDVFVLRVDESDCCGVG